jgi:hypothetical protein
MEVAVPLHNEFTLFGVAVALGVGLIVTIAVAGLPGQPLAVGIME